MYKIIDKGEGHISLLHNGKEIGTYYLIDVEYIKHAKWFLYEHTEYGDETEMILCANNPQTYEKEFVGFTWNGIEETVRNEDWF